MCDCDCELPKQERWRQIREEAMAGHVAVPDTGEFLVRDGKVMPVTESEMTEYIEDEVAYTVWVKRKDDDDE